MPVILNDLYVSDEEIALKLKTIDIDKVWKEIVDGSKVLIDDLREAPQSPRKAKGFTLVILYLFKGKLIHKNQLSKFCSVVLEKEQTDCQARHLSSQIGYYILNKGDSIPKTELVCPSGCHMLISIDKLSPRFNKYKRELTISAEDFNRLKEQNGNKCFTCGGLEGSFIAGELVKLQMGHKDPGLGMTILNIIPQCSRCNRPLKDEYIIEDNGNIKPNYNSIGYVKKVLLAIKNAVGSTELGKILKELNILD